MEVDKKTVILQAAMQLFRKNGFQGTKMIDVAEEAGIAKGTVYLYYKNKEELFRDVMNHLMDQFFYGLLKVVGNGTMEEQLERVALYELQDAQQNREYALIFMSNPELVSLYQSQFSDYLRRYEHVLHSILQLPEEKRADYAVEAFYGLLGYFKLKCIREGCTSDGMGPIAHFIVQTFLYGIHKK